ncbi:UNVERIFIED_CONTAM: hypothetical protein PYX00_007519 [Menopon gallinae]|uniref:Fibroblast growth factor n=1 Tax=Menopon gallinae TaxID=328185 RepID=A0AAW2HK09_9NEOP
MVVICGAVPSMVRSVKLYGESSNKFVRINMSGHVYAAEYNETDAYLNLTIRSIDFRSTLNIYSEQAGRYLCFNKSWKLVGMRDKSKRGAMCEFLESVESRGYNRYRSIANSTHFLAFNAKGKPLRYNPRLSMGYEEKCINFIKVDVMYNRTRNNSNMSGGGVYSPSPEVTRRFYKDGSHLISGKHRKRHKDKRRRA